MATLQIRDLPDPLHQLMQQRARGTTSASASRPSATCNRPVEVIPVSVGDRPWPPFRFWHKNVAADPLILHRRT